MADQTCFAFELTNRSSELSTLCEQLERIGETLKLSRRSIFEINLAMDEIFTNIISYGFTDQAEHVEVLVAVENDAVLLQVTDDGVGVPEELSRRSGLLNLAERAARYGGSCTITPRATGGSVLSWRVPLD